MNSNCINNNEIKFKFKLKLLKCYCNCGKTVQKYNIFPNDVVNVKNKT